MRVHRNYETLNANAALKFVARTHILWHYVHYLYPWVGITCIANGYLLVSTADADRYPGATWRLHAGAVDGVQKIECTELRIGQSTGAFTTAGSVHA